MNEKSCTAPNTIELSKLPTMTAAAVLTTAIKTVTSSNTLRTPASNFFSQHRRRSKTYSGEEFAQHFSGAGSESGDGEKNNKCAGHEEKEHPKELPSMMPPSTSMTPCHFLPANRRNEFLNSNRRSLIFFFFFLCASNESLLVFTYPSIIP